MRFLYKVLKTASLSQLFNTIPNSNTQHQMKNSGKIISFVIKHDYFKNSFFPSAITEWNKLDCYISSSYSCQVLKKCILHFIRPMSNIIYNIQNPIGVKYLRLRIPFSHTKEYILDKISAAVWYWSKNSFFLHCLFFNTHRQTLFQQIAAIYVNILTENEVSILNTLLFGEPNSENSFNMAMLDKSIKFILSTEKFNNSLF